MPAEPPHRPTAVVVTVGDELLTGEVRDTNGATLARFAADRGFAVAAAHTLPDDEDVLAAFLADLRGRCELCLLAGGLGPTPDDRTRWAVARALARPLVRRPELTADLEAKFARLGRPMPEANLVQADLPDGAEILPNPAGTAAGFLVGRDPVFAVLPGPPRELSVVLERSLAPRMAALGAAAPRPTRRYRCLGLGESSLAARLEPALAELRGQHPDVPFTVHYRADMPRVDVTLAFDRAPDPPTVEAFDRAIAGALAPALYGIGTADLADRLVAALAAAGHTLACAESCTGGRTAALVTAVPGASRIFRGGVVAYANAVKTACLGVAPGLLEAHGAVSEPVARAMAEGARTRLGADWAASTTGIAGPAGGTPEKPVGTVWVGIAGPGGTVARRLALHGTRHRIQHAAAAWALKLLWDELCGAAVARIEVADAPAPPRP